MWDRAPLEPAAYWRAAFIFDAVANDRAELGQKLIEAKSAISAAAGRGSVRLGVAEHFQSGGEEGSHDYTGWRRNDGAVEVTVGASDAGHLPSIAKAMREVLEPIVHIPSAEVMAGPTYFMVPPRLGQIFLSLCFKRDAAMTKSEFGIWWFRQHAPVAIPALGALLLGYDQVHCDDAMTDALAEAFQIPTQHYDAYDNLTWADWLSFLESTKDPVAGQRMFEDEVGRIDDFTRRHGFMRVL